MTTLSINQKNRQPTGYKVAPQSYASLELAANSLRSLLPREGRPSGANHKISGWRVLEQMLPRAGYEPHIVPVNELPEFAAYTIPDDHLVVIRRDVYEGLFTGSVFSRSTVIHELCHIVLKHNVTLHRGAVGRHEFCEDSEWQAKAMTAAVMMAVETCRQATCAAHLAEMCGTSVQAATFRLERLAKDRLILKQEGLF